jgi:APA family basic amino acid/polyamine antiporter
VSEAWDGGPGGAGTGLGRRLGTLDGAAVVVTNVVGTGIFLTPAFIARNVPDPLPFLGLWVAGAVLSVIGALSYAELAAMRPRAGGEYVYIREAFGPLAGFLSGWTSLVAGFSGAIAASAVGFAVYLDRLVPGAGSTEPLLRVPLLIGDLALTLTPRALIALALIVLFSLLHAAGLGPGRVVQRLLAWLNTGTILALVAFGFMAADGAPGGATAGAAPVEAAAASGAEPGAALVALVLVMFTFSGWNAAAYVAGEFREPGRKLPRALLGGTAVVAVLYMALNLLYLRVLGIGGVAAAEATGDRVAETLWGATGTHFFTPLILLVLVSSVSAMVLTGPRVYYAMARDDCLPAAFGEVGEGGAPAFSIWVQAAWSGVLVLTGGFEALLTYTGFAIVLFAGLAVAALFVLRRTEPDADRPFRVWGYPLAPALFLLASAAMVVQSVLHAPGPSLAGLGLVALGVPAYLGLRRG